MSRRLVSVKKEPAYQRKITAPALLKSVKAFNPEKMNSNAQDRFFQFLLRYAADVSAEWAPARDRQQDDKPPVIAAQTPIDLDSMIDLDLVHMIIDLDLVYKEVEMHSDEVDRLGLLSFRLKKWLDTQVSKEGYVIAMRVVNAFRQCENSVFYLKKEPSVLALRDGDVKLNKAYELFQEKKSLLEKSRPETYKEFKKAETAFFNASSEVDRAQSSNSPREAFYRNLSQKLLKIINNSKETIRTRLRAFSFLTCYQFLYFQIFREDVRVGSVCEIFLPEYFEITPIALKQSLEQLDLNDLVSVGYVLDQLFLLNSLLTKVIDQTVERTGSDEKREEDNENFYRMMKLWLYSIPESKLLSEQVEALQKRTHAASNNSYRSRFQSAIESALQRTLGKLPFAMALKADVGMLMSKNFSDLDVDVLDKLIFDGTLYDFLNGNFLISLSKYASEIPSPIQFSLNAIKQLMTKLSKECLAALTGSTFLGPKKRDFAIRFLALPAIFQDLNNDGQLQVSTALSTKLKTSMNRFYSRELLALMGHSAQDALGSVKLSEIANLLPGSRTFSDLVMPSPLTATVNADSALADLKHQFLVQDEYDILFDILSASLKRITGEPITERNLVTQLVVASPDRLGGISFCDSYEAERMWKGSAWIFRVEEINAYLKEAEEMQDIIDLFLKKSHQDARSRGSLLQKSRESILSSKENLSYYQRNVRMTQGDYSRLQVEYRSYVSPLIALLEHYLERLPRHEKTLRSNMSLTIDRLKNEASLIKLHYSDFILSSCDSITEEEFLRRIMRKESSPSISNLMDQAEPRLLTSRSTGLFSSKKLSPLETSSQFLGRFRKEEAFPVSTVVKALVNMDMSVFSSARKITFPYKPAQDADYDVGLSASNQ